MRTCRIRPATDAVVGDSSDSFVDATQLPAGLVLYLGSGLLDIAGAHPLACTPVCLVPIGGKYGNAYRFDSSNPDVTTTAARRPTRSMASSMKS